MYGVYYKTPIRFKEVMEKKELEKTTLEVSIAQYITMVITSSFGECKFNEHFGCKIWEIDFDLLMDNNTLKERIKNDIRNAITIHETRLDVREVAISISEIRAASYKSQHRMKKRINIQIQGYVKKTNRPFNFQNYFFIGPLSYS